MPIRAGFAETDITPPLGTHKIGWLRDLVADQVLDPLSARVAVLEAGEERVAFVQLDTLCVRWTQVSDIRRRVADQFAFPGDHVMVAATHNHAGPAVADAGDVKRDDAYVATLTDKIVAAFGAALDNAQEAEVGFASVPEFGVAFNRRIIMRDGTVCTHGRFADPNALCFEGPIDPEVAVVAARSPDGALLGAIVNFACHPTHHGGSAELSAGFPGALAREMKAKGCPVALFLNGASGNLHTSDPRTGQDKPKEQVGAILAADAARAIEATEFRTSLAIECRARTLQLPFRQVTDGQVKGTVRGAQRFIDPAIYDRGMPRLLERIRAMGTQPAEVQAILLDEVALVGIPAEYFVQHGLRIKEQTHPRHTLVVGHANGMVGYVPHREAFLRGGYETTFFSTSRLAPEAGDLLADCAIDLIRTGRR